MICLSGPRKWASSWHFYSCGFRTPSLTVIPAKAGISFQFLEIPAFAGMTDFRMNHPTFTFERASGQTLVCGIDEAGRGPWAGPVVASAVILNQNNFPQGLNDSKKLSPEKREALFDPIMNSADVGIGIVRAAEIDAINILQATYLAMARAMQNLKLQPTLALVDGNRAPPLSCAVQTIIKGDGLSLSIAAASIIAKVTRDRIMVEMDKQFPDYGFAKHKGYGTAAHAAMLLKYGPCAEHRKSFKPISKLVIPAKAGI
jgi:ribonuclease HII